MGAEVWGKVQSKMDFIGTGRPHGSPPLAYAMIMVVWDLIVSLFTSHGLPGNGLLDLVLKARWVGFSHNQAAPLRLGLVKHVGRPVLCVMGSGPAFGD